MPDANLIKSDEYEEIAATYQCVEISRLNKILESYGLSEEQRKSICGDYFFRAGYFLDAGKLMVNGREYSPQVHFLPYSPPDEPRLIIDVFVTSEFFAWHEYAFGDLDHVFEGEFKAPEND